MSVIYKNKRQKKDKITNSHLFGNSKELLIPKIFHRTWFGNNPMPKEFIRYGETWLEKHPDWEMKLWTEENLIPLKNQAEFDKATKLAQKSDIARYELIYRFGGIYIDTDFECLRNIENLISGIEAFTAYEEPGLVNCAISGCVPGHPVFKQLINNLPHSIEAKKHLPINHQAGPHYQTSIIKNSKDIVVFPEKYFYPYLYTEMHRKHDKFPEAYAVHHWAKSWV